MIVTVQPPAQQLVYVTFHIKLSYRVYRKPVVFRTRKLIDVFFKLQGIPPDTAFFIFALRVQP